MIAFKILEGRELASLLEDGRFAGTSADLKVGFIHLSTANQLGRVLQKHYAGVANIHLVAIDLDMIRKEVKWEEASNGQMYPHLYDILESSDIFSHSPLQFHSDGSFEIPELI